MHVGADAGALGFFPKHWPPGPVVVGAVLPKKIADEHRVKDGAVWGFMALDDSYDSQVGMINLLFC